MGHCIGMAGRSEHDLPSPMDIAGYGPGRGCRSRDDSRRCASHLRTFANVLRSHRPCVRQRRQAGRGGTNAGVLHEWEKVCGDRNSALTSALRLQEPLIIAVHFFIYLFSRSLLRLTTGHSVTSIGLAMQRMCSLFMELQTRRPIFFGRLETRPTRRVRRGPSNG